MLPTTGVSLAVTVLLRYDSDDGTEDVVLAQSSDGTFYGFYRGKRAEVIIRDMLDSMNLVEFERAAASGHFPIGWYLEFMVTLDGERLNCYVDATSHIINGRDVDGWDRQAAAQALHFIFDSDLSVVRVIEKIDSMVAVYVAFLHTGKYVVISKLAGSVYAFYDDKHYLDIGSGCAYDKSNSPAEWRYQFTMVTPEGIRYGNFSPSGQTVNGQDIAKGWRQDEVSDAFEIMFGIEGDHYVVILTPKTV